MYPIDWKYFLYVTTYSQSAIIVHEFWNWKPIKFWWFHVHRFPLLLFIRRNYVQRRLSACQTFIMSQYKRDMTTTWINLVSSSYEFNDEFPLQFIFCKTEHIFVQEIFARCCEWKSIETIIYSRLARENHMATILLQFTKHSFSRIILDYREA